MTDLKVRRKYPASEFCDSAEMHLSAKEKAAIVADWERFVVWRIGVDIEELKQLDQQSRLPRQFTRRLYEAFNLRFGYIAHYNRLGFFQERLLQRRDFIETLMSARRQDIAHYNTWGAHHDQGDLNRAMMAVAKEYLQMEAISIY